MTMLSVVSENLTSGATREPWVGWGGAFLEEVELVTYYMCLQVKKQKAEALKWWGQEDSF